MSDSDGFLERLERRMETGFSEIHTAFSKLMDRMDAGARESDARFRALEQRQAVAGKPSWESMAVGLTLLVSILGAAVSWVVGQTDKKAAIEKVSYLEARMETMKEDAALREETARRIATIETKLGLIVALRP